MPGAFSIFINGAELENFTDATLSRSKGEMTGTLNFSLFMGYMPGSPVATSAICGAEIIAYVGGAVAFVGKIDRRRGTGDHSGRDGTKDSDTSQSDGGGEAGGVTRSVNIGPNEYTVKITARGKTKMLIDSSHRHPTTNIMQPTDEDAFNALLEGTEVSLEWMAEAQQLDKVRFRDGGRIADEIKRLCSENCHYAYETREGNLRVTDDTGRTTGDPLILGENILSFSAEQSEDQQRSEILVKGQRSAKEVWGEDALIETKKSVSDASSTNQAVVNIQHYGDATPEALERRANFEANKRNAASKEVKIEVFHVQAQGAPWDIGSVHYVEVPPEGIFDPMECTGLEYQVDATKTLKTVLTLNPIPSTGISGGSGGFGFSFDALEEFIDVGRSRKVAAYAGQQAGFFPVSWSGPSLSIANPLTSKFNLGKPGKDKYKGLDDEGEEDPPAVLGPQFGGHDR